METITTSPTEISNDDQLVDPTTLKFTRRAINSIEEAYELAKRFEQFSKSRVVKSALIMRKFNDEPPYDSKKLEAAGESWRHNFSSGFMSSLVKRSLPQYMNLIKSLKYLTNSMLRDKSSQGEQKSEHFKRVTTETIRSWNDWPNLTSLVVLENVLFGYSFVGWKNKYDWRPQFFRQDELFLYDDVGQLPKEWPAYVIKNSFLIYELAKYLATPEESKANGWNLENLAKAINSAQPPTNSTTTDSRRYEDLVRESSVGKSFQNGAKVIETYEVFSQEVSGRVSYYMVNARTGDELRTVLDMFDSMEECVSCFALEAGKLQGSKGAGRLLYNIHIAADRARNMACDNFYLSGMVWVKKTSKATNRAGLIANHPFALIPENYEIVEVDLKADYQSFLQLDRHLSTMAELLIGAFMPSQLVTGENSKRTAAETNYIASIETQIKDGLLERFFNQLMDMVFVMQKRLYSAENIAEARNMIFVEKQNPGTRVLSTVFAALKNIFMSTFTSKGVVAREEPKIGDREAVLSCKELLELGLSEQDILTLANTHPRDKAQDVSQQRTAMIDAIVAKYIGNPQVDQIELMKMDISSKLGSDVAERLALDDKDDALEAFQTWRQIVEITSIFAGETVPVLLSDDDLVHLKVMTEKGQKIFENLTPQMLTPETLPVIKSYSIHYDNHLNNALSKGISKEELAPFIQMNELAQTLLKSVPESPLAVQPPTVPTGAEPMLSSPDVETPMIPEDPNAMPTDPMEVLQNKPLSKGPKDI